jgi:phosphate transport system substrate-binding protein
LDDYPHASPAQVATSNAQVISVVGDDPQAIGYVTFGSLDERVRALSLNDVMPSPQTINDGDYPLTAQIMFVAMAEPRGAVRDFLSWGLTRD